MTKKTAEISKMSTCFTVTFVVRMQQTSLHPVSVQQLRLMQVNFQPSLRAYLEDVRMLNNRKVR
jgi:hypothetical protein